MGFLTTGNTFSWEEASEKPTEFVRKHGILQFLNIYNKIKDRTRDSLRWGDEIEYTLISLDRQTQTAKLSLRGHELLDKFQQIEEQMIAKGQEPTMLWRPEYGKHMVEGTPGAPFGANGLADLLAIEKSMKERRRTLEKFLNSDEYIVSMTTYPMLGNHEYGPFTKPHFEVGGPVAMSLFTPDEIIHPHFRFSTLTANIRKRRGSKVEINVPLYRDTNTSSSPLPYPKEVRVPGPPPSANVPYNIYMDSMAFGMGCCCLQTTLQCCNINEARTFYDQLAVLSPILLALTAATPFFRGYLADTDVRWHVISASVDDRTEEELGLKPLQNNKFVINKSRYDSIDCYISLDNKFQSRYNDLNLVYDKDIKRRLVEGGVDELLAYHIAHLFIRDPLVIYRDKLAVDNEKHSDHFENIQSTNWQTMRFKPPPPNSPIGWRVEFRPMELQLTDFENAAFVVFIVLMTRILSAFDLNFYIPISKVDENMKTAHKRNAVANEKFWFRRNVNTKGGNDDSLEYDLMSINEIFNGKKYSDNERFPGLIELVNIYMDTINMKEDVRKHVTHYLNFISKRASGELQTPAQFLRNIVLNHPDYNHDSKITPKINFDIVDTCIKIGRGELHPPELLGNFTG